MSYAAIDCSMPWHPAMLKLTDRQFRLHITGLLYANEHLTDGMLMREAVVTFPKYSKDAAAHLVACGLWSTNHEGWEIRNFLKWNKSRIQVEEMRDKKRNAGRKGGLKTQASAEAGA